MNTDKGCKTIYHKGRKGKQLLQKSSFPKILKEQTGQTEVKLAFGPRSETENTFFHHVSRNNQLACF